MRRQTLTKIYNYDSKVGKRMQKKENNAILNDSEGTIVLD